jgi:ribosome-associated protein
VPGAGDPRGHRVDAHAGGDLTDVPIRGEMIRLGQLLKLAGVVGAGGEAKALLASVQVLVNGEPETRRGRQLHPGDEVRVSGEMLRVVSEEAGG